MKNMCLFLSMFIIIGVFSFADDETVPKVKKNYISTKIGDLDFYFQPDIGVQLKVFGIPMIKESSLWIMSPNWTKRIYSFPDNPKMIEEATITKVKGGKKIVLHHKLSGDKAAKLSGTETYTILKDNRFIAELEFTLKLDEPAIFEWKVAGINADPLFGKAISIASGDKTKNFSLPVEAASGDLKESTLLTGFDKMTIESLIGTIQILSKASDKMLLIDYRKNKWSRADCPLYWLGLSDNEIKKDVKYSYRVEFIFPKELKANIDEKAGKPVKVVMNPSDGVQIPKWGQNYIIPKPKSMTGNNKKMPLNESTKIYIGKAAGEDIKKAVAFLTKDLKDIYSLDLAVVEDEPQSSQAGSAIILGETGRFDFPSKICEAASVKTPDKDEGYALVVGDKSTAVSAKTVKGIFYGITTLLQLINIDESGIWIKGAVIEDYPSLDFRGVHCLSARNGGDEISKAMRTLMARFKMNTLVWECEYIIWDCCPELAHKEYGMTKDEAKKVIKSADDNFIEIIPLVQSLGHSEWIFVNGHNLDIAEDPDKPYAYCPTNPDTYKFIFKVYQEALDFFKPRIFHIGHDEITTDASRFPYRSKGSGLSAAELILGDIDKHYAWFKDKNVQIMLWGDMFLHSSEASGAAFAESTEDAKYRRSRLPKDVIVADWHYDASKPEDFKSLKVWKDEGYKAVGSGWYLPMNIANLVKASIDNDSWGYLQTTWAGFNFKITNNNEAWYQYWAYLWAAYYSWSGDTTPDDKLPFSAREKFLDLWFERKPVTKKQAGYMVDLSGLYNRKLEDSDARDGWIEYGSDLDLSSLPTGEVLFEDTKFLIKKNSKGDGALFLSGKLNPKGAYPESAKIEFEETKASEAHFLLTSQFKASDGAKVGEIIIKYAGGGESKVSLIYGKSIFAFIDGRRGDNTKIAWSGRSKSNTEIFISDYVWKNPNPAKKIKSIKLVSETGEAAPILLAVTAVN